MNGFAVFRFCVALSVGLLTATASLADSKKPRVASLNLCADTLLMQYADPEQIASITWLSTDPGLSPYAAQAQLFHHNRGHAEDIIKLSADLVLTGPSTSPTTLALLKRLGVATLYIADSRSIAEIYTNVRSLTHAIDQTQRGERSLQLMTESLTRALRRAASKPLALWPNAAFIQPNGLTVGSGSLSDELLNHAGFHNAATSIGLQTYQQFPLESLLRVNPDLLIVPKRQRHYPALAQQLLEHPAFSNVAHFYEIAPAELICGTTRVAKVVSALAEKRDQIGRL